MENYNSKKEIEQLRNEFATLSERVEKMSARMEKMEKEKSHVSNTKQNVTYTQRKEQVRRKSAKPVKEKEIRFKKDLEGNVGKNAFAILASLLVLIGVGVFIATIYDRIPESIKIIAIYLFGFILLGTGITIYNKNKNRFWIGVASCGLAELLVSIITSYSYFKVFSLPITYLLVILWVIGSFYLTKIQPVVFKTISFLGFLLSTLFGVSLLTEGDGIFYVGILICYILFSVFFICSNKEQKIMNTVFVFLSTIGFWIFIDISYYFPEKSTWIINVAIILSIIVLHELYFTISALESKVYPFYSMITLVMVAIFMSDFSDTIVLPILFLFIAGLWYMNYLFVEDRVCRLFYSGFTIPYILITSLIFGIDGAVWGIDSSWFALVFIFFSILLCTLYLFTRKRDVAWMGFLSFVLFTGFVGDNCTVSWMIIAFLISISFLWINHSSFCYNDKALQVAWYMMAISISNNICWEFIYWLENNPLSDPRIIRESVHCGYFAILAILNTIYLHFSAYKEKAYVVDLKTVCLMILQGILFANCVPFIYAEGAVLIIMGILITLMILSYSLYYTIKTRGEHSKLLVWQFIKFSLYCFMVLNILETSSIIINIALFIIAIIAIVLGFHWLCKPVRVYGLVLSLIDVVSLVLFNVNHSDSLQLAGGIIICGFLCFLISFIYSRVSRRLEEQDVKITNDYL